MLNISVSTIDADGARSVVFCDLGVESSSDSGLWEYGQKDAFKIEGYGYSLKASFSAFNLKGNIALFKEGRPLINALTKVDGVFVLMYKIPDGCWVEVTVSE